MNLTNSSVYNSGQKHKNTSIDKKLTSLEKLIARLETKHHELAQQVQKIKATQYVQVTPASVQIKNDQTPELIEEWRNPLDNHKTKDPVSTYIEAYEQELDDPEWRIETETTVNTILRNLEVADTLLDQVECRETACRLEFLHPEGSGGKFFIETVLPAEPFTKEFYSELSVNADGLHTTVVFIARPTHKAF